MTNKDNSKKIEILESRINNNNRSLDAVEEQLEEHEQRIDELEEENDELRSKIVTDSSYNGLSDAERIIIGSWDDVSTQRSQNKDRAIQVVENWSDWSELAKGGYHRMKFSSIQETLNLEYQNAKRVAKFVERLTGGKIERTENHNNNLILKQTDKIVKSVDELD